MSPVLLGQSLPFPEIQEYKALPGKNSTSHPSQRGVLGCRGADGALGAAPAARANCRWLLNPLLTATSFLEYEYLVQVFEVLIPPGSHAAPAQLSAGIWRHWGGGSSVGRRVGQEHDGVPGTGWGCLAVNWPLPRTGGAVPLSRALGSAAEPGFGWSVNTAHPAHRDFSCLLSPALLFNWVRSKGEGAEDPN